MRKMILIVGVVICPMIISAQDISGVVLDANDDPIIGANVYWLEGTAGEVTDIEGRFSISQQGMMLIASFVGYANDTIDVSGLHEVRFRLQESNTLGEVVVKGRKSGISISNVSTMKIENITEGELKKAACCDLAGCFETQTSVDAQVTNVITNAKELRISGLSGVYNQVLIDGFPMIQGLSYTYGLTSIPGTLVQNIYVSKGANSVLQGYEGMSGQINVITKDPDLDAPLFLNVFANSMGEKQLNSDYSFAVGEWQNIVAVHTTLPAGQRDKDLDRFMDLPRLNRFSISDKWKYSDENEWGWSSEISLRYLQEGRTGGQLGYDPDTDLGSSTTYGQKVMLQQPELSAKSAFKWDDYHSLTWFVSAYHQSQDSWFGTLEYDAKQSNLYNKLQYQLNYGTETQNSLKTGVSFRYLNLDESIDFSNNDLGRTYDQDYHRSEKIPGLFVENNLVFGKFNWLAGMRLDHHNDFGLKFAPRTLLKYEVNPLLVVRANVGAGWRTVNLFSENINLLVSSRDIIFAERMEPEQAVNAGINITQKIDTRGLNGYISADFYHTDFSNQIFPDYDSDPTKAIIKNFRGTSISNSLQIEAGMQIMETTELKFGYSFTDVYREEEEGVKQQLPFNSRHKLLGVLSYRPSSNKYQIDLNAHWYGQQRLPNTATNPVEFRRPDFSDTYTILNTQLTYNFTESFSIYGGVENIFDFRQERPIISWQNPFGPYFDTSFVWGPTQGRMSYVGVRYQIAKGGE